MKSTWFSLVILSACFLASAEQSMFPVQRNQSKNTKLHDDVGSKNLEGVKEILQGDDAEGYKNARDKVGRTPVFYATTPDWFSILSALLDARVDVNVQDNNGRTPVSFAAQNKNVRGITRLFCAGANIHIADKTGFSPLLWAVGKEHIDVLTVLLQYGANANDQDQNRKTVLHWAAQYANVDGVKKLLKAGAHKDSKDKNGMAPIHFATMHDSDTLQVLIDAGANVNSKDNNGMSAMSWAAKHGNVNALYKLHAAGAKILEDKDNNGNTPLHFALFYCHQALWPEMKDIINSTDTSNKFMGYKNKNGKHAFNFLHFGKCIKRPQK